MDLKVCMGNVYVGRSFWEQTFQFHVVIASQPRFMPGIGLVLPLLQPLLIQPDPPASMGVWHENRVGKVGMSEIVWVCLW